MAKKGYNAQPVAVARALEDGRHLDGTSLGFSVDLTQARTWGRGRNTRVVVPIDYGEEGGEDERAADFIRELTASDDLRATPPHSEFYVDGS